MTTYVPITSIKRYPDEYVSRRKTAAIQKDGLIEPILLTSAEDVHPSSREASEAFIREVERLKELNIPATDSIIVVYWHELDAEEQREYK